MGGSFSWVFRSLLKENMVGVNNVWRGLVESNQGHKWKICLRCLSADSADGKSRFIGRPELSGWPLWFEKFLDLEKYLLLYQDWDDMSMVFSQTDEVGSRLLDTWVFGSPCWGVPQGQSCNSPCHEEVSQCHSCLHHQEPLNVANSPGMEERYLANVHDVQQWGGHHQEWHPGFQKRLMAG